LHSVAQGRCGMKILHIADGFSYCDGSARHVYFLAREQKSRGHSVHVVMGSGDAADLLSTAGISECLIPTAGHAQRSLLNFLTGIRDLRRHFLSFDPDIVHLHHFYAANLSRLASFPGRLPSVLTVHGNIPCKGRLPLHPPIASSPSANPRRDPSSHAVHASGTRLMSFGMRLLFWAWRRTSGAETSSSVFRRAGTNGS